MFIQITKVFEVAFNRQVVHPEGINRKAVNIQTEVQVDANQLHYFHNGAYEADIDFIYLSINANGHHVEMQVKCRRQRYFHLLGLIPAVVEFIFIKFKQSPFFIF